MTLVWPRQSNCEAIFGRPLRPDGTVDAVWETANITRISPPYKIYFIGKPAKVSIHKKTAEAWMAWFEAMWDHAGKDQKIIDAWGMSNYAGGYFPRPMRGGRALSMHSYGIATDWDAPRNGFHDRTPRLAQYRKQVIEPFLKLGGVWGGDWNGNGDTLDERSCDGMHFQFARL